MTSPYAQDGFRIGFDWGLAGAAAVPDTITAVVDVLSFTTAVTVAADLGIAVYPYRWRDETAAVYAKQYDAVLAVGRSEAGPGDVSLSPVTNPPGTRDRAAGIAVAQRLDHLSATR